jgi:hypothetical protein
VGLVSFLKKHKNNSCKNCIVQVLKVMHFLLSYIQCHVCVGYVHSHKGMCLLWCVDTKTYVIVHRNAKAVFLLSL